MFTIAISCLTTSNLPWFMDLPFQIPMQYCSWQHQTLLSPPDTFRTGHHFHFGSASSFLLELFLCSSPVAYWVPTNLGHSSFSILSFCLFILFMGFSKQEHCSGLPFPSPMDHVLSELSTMTRPSWVAQHSKAHSFIELDRAVIHVISLVSFFSNCGFHSVCPHMDKRLVEASWWKGLAVVKSGSSGGLVFPSPEEFPTVCCDLQSQRLWYSQ